MEETILGQPEAVSRAISGNLDKLRDASRLVAAARRVRLCGVGASGYAAEIGAQLLRAIGMDARADNSFDLAVYPTSFDPGDLLIVFSHRGDNAHTLQALRRALISGLKTIGITGQGSALRGPEVIIETVPLERSSTHTAAFTSAVAIMATIAARVEPRSTLTAALPGLPDHLREMLASRAMIGAVAAELVQPERRALIVGAGAGHALARAGALALKEASYVPAEANHIEDALHGGLHGLRSGDILIQIAPGGRADARQADLAGVADILI